MLMTFGSILNISAHGALVSSDSFPGLGENVLIRLKRPVRSDWIGWDRPKAGD